MKMFLALILAVQFANPCLTCPSVGVAGDSETKADAVGAFTVCAPTNHAPLGHECAGSESANLSKSLPTEKRSSRDIGPVVFVIVAEDVLADQRRIGLRAPSASSCTPFHRFTILRI
jgi:hypothetical protein